MVNESPTAKGMESDGKEANVRLMKITAVKSKRLNKALLREQR